ncbi:MAG: methylated-DNA--[protein]-cysteine S-methyltransferase [Deltaproteobacteria bacterium]|nr:methylated-DNA--[protein]-cysteine S-methyltransferase [Deltaproteobacteria bacterium]
MKIESADGKGPLWYALYPSPLGDIFIAAGSAGVTDLSIRANEAAFLERMEGRHGAAPLSRRSSLTRVFDGLDRYFSARPVALDLPVDLSGTPFEIKVWNVLRSIPWGVARSYGWVAGRAGNGRGARAVGGACGANPVPIIIPCHRVLRADGSLGGYTGGEDIKRALLKIEGVEFSG